MEQGAGKGKVVRLRRAKGLDGTFFASWIPSVKRSERLKIARMIAWATRNHIESVLRQGRLDITNRAPEDVLRQISSTTLKLAATGKLPKLAIIIDHTQELLKAGRAHAREKRADFSLLFYATFIEHWVNGEIVRLAKNRGLSASDITSLLRETPLRGKPGCCRFWEHRR